MKKVYIWNLTGDLVLMDYNLIVGDTFMIDVSSFYSCQYVVTGTDSTLINSVPHKVWHFSRFDSTNNYGHWCDVIEGVGCIQGPMYMFQPSGIIGEYGCYMYCFSNQGITPPFSPSVNGMDNATSCTYYSNLNVTPMSLNSSGVIIFPNPTTNELTISASDKIANITISNLLGQTTFTQNYNSTQVQVDVSNLPTGIYFIKVNGTEVRKFVKQ